MNLPAVHFNFENSLSFTKEECREVIGQLESAMMDSPNQVEIPLIHHFSPGVYAREISIEKGTLLVGKIHKHQTMNILSQGEVSVFSIDGVMRFRAPFTFVSSPGAKRVIFAHEDSTWTTIHGTHETNLEKIEEEFIAKTYDEVVTMEGREILKLKES